MFQNTSDIISDFAYIELEMLVMGKYYVSVLQGNPHKRTMENRENAFQQAPVRGN